MNQTLPSPHHSHAWFEGIDKASPCEAGQVANETEARRQLLKEFEQPITLHLFPEQQAIALEKLPPHLCYSIRRGQLTATREQANEILAELKSGKAWPDNDLLNLILLLDMKLDDDRPKPPADFQPLSDKLFGYMNNDDLISVDVDATSARY